MDAYDLFRKLGSGAKFDFKRFRSDAEKLHVTLLEYFSLLLIFYYGLNLVNTTISSVFAIKTLHTIFLHLVTVLFGSILITKTYTHMKSIHLSVHR